MTDTLSDEIIYDYDDLEGNEDKIRVKKIREKLQEVIDELSLYAKIQKNNEYEYGFTDAMKKSINVLKSKMGDKLMNNSPEGVNKALERKTVPQDICSNPNCNHARHVHTKKLTHCKYCGRHICPMFEEKPSDFPDLDYLTGRNDDLCENCGHSKEKKQLRNALKYIDWMEKGDKK
jgi:hypothetical protein